MSIVNTLSSAAVCRTVAGAYDLARGAFPAVVRLETTNACNAKCVICPHRDLKRPIARMDEGLFGQLVDECAEGGCREIHLHNFGEPLLDKDLEQRVRYAKERGIPKVKIFSNGSLLDERRAAGLIEAGLDELKVSFDGATREEFEQIRVPLKFDQVVENITRLVKLRNERRSAMQIKVACCSTTDRESTMNSLAAVVDGFSFGKIHNWATDPSQNGHGVRKPCSRLWRTFTVLANGDVALCCLDYDGRHLLGRVDAEHSIRDVFTGPGYQKVRHLHRRGRQGEIDLCRHCTKSFV